MDSSISTFAKRLKKLRTDCGITQKELASVTGIGYGTIIGYENGKREPNAKNMATLEQFFGVSGAYLRGESDSPRQLDFKITEMYMAPPIDRQSSQTYSYNVIDLSDHTLDGKSTISEITAQVEQCFTYSDVATRQAASQLLKIAVGRCVGFIRVCAAETTRSDESIADENRARAMLEISDALLTAQKSILKQVKQKV